MARCDASRLLPDELEGRGSSRMPVPYCFVTQAPSTKRTGRPQRIDYRVELAAEAPARAAESLGLRSPYCAARWRLAHCRPKESYSCHHNMGSWWGA